MSFQSLIAHNGNPHLKSSSVEKPKPSTTEIKPIPKPNLHNSPIVAPESNPTSEKQIEEVPEANVKETKTETLTTIDPISPKLDTVTLIPGFEESIFAFLIASPFLLLGLKKWIHK